MSPAQAIPGGCDGLVLVLNSGSVLEHLAEAGYGCSAAAVRGGVSVDTTIGLTPLEGLVMGTRSGDVDPGLLGYMAGRTGMSLDELTQALNTDSGLEGLSGVATTCARSSPRPRTETSGRDSPSRFSCTGWPRRSPVVALVVPTDEELMIARDTASVLADGSQPPSTTGLDL